MDPEGTKRVQPEDIYEYNIPIAKISRDEFVELVSLLKHKDQKITRILTKKTELFKEPVYSALLSHEELLYSASGIVIGKYVSERNEMEHSGHKIGIKYMSHIMADSLDCAIIIKSQLALTSRKNMHIMF